MAEKTIIEAIREALDEEMARDERVMILGEDVGVRGGVFRVTEGLMDKYGEERVIDTILFTPLLTRSSTRRRACAIARVGNGRVRW
jgi:pyruvate/2-oxoglutarate/acetoin dehydrogenase E1 component